ncbi:MAG: BTAD domain-containing putative transcriptional regulator [Anaerolineae bacterium]
MSTFMVMEGLILNLFGQPNLRQQDQVVELKSRKGWALLAYLVLMPNPVSRESIATLFWPEHDAVGARRNLRRLLYTLNQSPVEPYLQTDGEVVSLKWDGEIDVRSFLNRLDDGDWTSAVALYNGHLLDGIVIGDSNRFEAWLTDQREQLRQQMLQALTALTDEYLENNNWIDAETTVRKQLSLDNWNELQWRRLITILAENGRRAQALAEYNNCLQVLKKELGVTPSLETSSLYESIRDGRFATTNQNSQQFAVPPPKPLPHPAARDALLSKIEEHWIENVLHESLRGESALNLKKLTQPTALAYPWTTLIHRPESRRQMKRPDQTIGDLFDAEGRGLLILGEPGSGKTTTLLTLSAEMVSRAKVDAAQSLPVILPLGSWRGQPFAEWVQAEINEKYRILPEITADWLAENQLLLLCDGLDELPVELQPDCVAAINQFRESHGLTPIAVCSRQADYDALPAPLNLNGAISLQPLDSNQIESFLGEKFSGLAELLLSERKLQRMARSPLLLSLMAAVFGSVSAENLKALAGDTAQLFRVYVSQMTADVDDSPRLLQQLRWLARQLSQRNQPIFLLDRIQPDWLDSRRQIKLYFFLSRFVGAFVLAVAWAFREAGWGAVPFAIGSGVTVGLAELLLLRVGPIKGGARAVQRLSSWFSTDEKRLQEHLIGPLSRAFMMGAIVAIIGSWMGWVALMNGLIFGLFFGWRAPKHTADDDIRLVEKLAWTWRGFGIGVAVSLLLGVVVFFYNRADPYAVGTGMLSFAVLFGAFGGLQGRAISTKTRPNEGMWLSWRNALVGGTVVGGAMLLVALAIEFGRGESLIPPLLVGLQYFVMAALWYGWLDLINHFMLRRFLATSGRLPWKVVAFLEQSSRLRLLYRVGSGYLFLHPQLRDYFVETSDEDFLEISSDQIDLDSG